MFWLLVFFSSYLSKTLLAVKSHLPRLLRFALSKIQSMGLFKITTASSAFDTPSIAYSQLRTGTDPVVDIRRLFGGGDEKRMPGTFVDDDEYNDNDDGFPWPNVKSQAQADWEYQKKSWDQTSEPLDRLMDMVGLEPVKAEFVRLNAFREAAKRQELSLQKERFNAVFIGNPGTGKTTVAELYAAYLHSADVIPGEEVLRVSATSLDAMSVKDIEAMLEKLDDGGVFVVEEAHHIVSSSFSDSRRALLDFLLSEVDAWRGKIVFIFAGYGKAMETFCSHSPALPSLFPTTLTFPDYQDYELHQLFVQELQSSFENKVEIEGDPYGLYTRIVARRLGRGRGKHGFGNARDVHNEVSKIRKRQAARLFRAQKAGKHKNKHDLVLTREDLIGPPPSSALDSSAAWKKLQTLVGLKAVKTTVEALIHQLQLNYERELAEQPLVQCSLNRLFLGNPGTGKTTVASLYGQILADIGLLSKGEVVVRKPPEFIGDALGSSERNTLAILNATKGKVLVIDEAYMLGGGGDKPGSNNGGDPFRTAVIDTIVGEVQSTAVEDRCVLLLGYRDRMESMLNESNEALARRFPLATAFQFEDYNPAELREILELKLREQGFRASDAAKKAACEELERARNRPGFGNAGEVDILLDKAKVRHHQRMLASGGTVARDLLLPIDFDPDFERGSRPLLDVRELFSDFVGCEEVVEKLEDFQFIVQNMRELGKDQPDGPNPRDEIPFTFLFCGPPGTGKTTTAKRMGQLFYDLGFLATKEVLERSATDLIGEYVGHTGPKTKRLFDAALGRVLLIDEAYKLAEGPYGKEAVVEMLNTLTRDKYRNKLVVILAGYEHEINKLMAANDGLSSRFPEMIRFQPPTVQHCIKLLFNCLKAKNLDVRAAEQSKQLSKSLETTLGRLAGMPTWGNARDVQTLAKTINLKVLKSRAARPSRVVPEDVIRDAVSGMLSDRQDRQYTHRRTPQTSRLSDRRSVSPSEVPPPYADPDQPQTQQQHNTLSRPKVNIKSNVDVKKSYSSEKNLEELVQNPRQGPPRDDNGDEGADGVPRDAGVPEHVWNDLQADKQAASRRKSELAKARKMLNLMNVKIANARAALATGAGTPQQQQQFREALRIAEKNVAAQKERVDEKEEAERKEREIQSRLAGKCPLGFEWIKQEAGYRCAGGSHYISNEQIESGDW